MHLPPCSCAARLLASSCPPHSPRRRELDVARRLGALGCAPARRSSGSWLLLLLAAPAVLAATACGAPSDDAGQVSSGEAVDAAPDEAGEELRGRPAPSTFALTVVGGSGGGRFKRGAVVHVWADVDPRTQTFVEWTGTGARHLERSTEWHTTLVMPARDLTVRAAVASEPRPFEVVSYAGSTGRPKAARLLVAPAARGLLLLLHGTGGSSALPETVEARSLAAVAVRRGYTVLAPEAEEVVAGDSNRDGKIRWNPELAESNVDLGSIDALIAQARASGWVGRGRPTYVVGMSNGGAMAVSLGAVEAMPWSTRWPRLRFGAVVSYCAGGRLDAALATRTPTAFYLCAHDDVVDNDDALEAEATIARRGIRTELEAHAASPLPDARLRRAGLAADASAALVAELRAAGFVDGATGLLTQPTDAIVAAARQQPGLLPTLSAQSGSTKAAIVDQLRATQAEHQLYSDWAQRTVDFLEALR